MTFFKMYLQIQQGELQFSGTELQLNFDEEQNAIVLHKEEEDEEEGDEEDDEEEEDEHDGEKDEADEEDEGNEGEKEEDEEEEQVDEEEKRNGGEEENETDTEQQSERNEKSEETESNNRGVEDDIYYQTSDSEEHPFDEVIESTLATVSKICETLEDEMVKTDEVQNSQENVTTTSSQTEIKLEDDSQEVRRHKAEEKSDTPLFDLNMTDVSLSEDKDVERLSEIMKYKKQVDILTFEKEKYLLDNQEMAQQIKGHAHRESELQGLND